jgi:hypothetical protein
MLDIGSAELELLRDGRTLFSFLRRYSDKKNSKFIHMAELIEAVEKGSGGGEDNL